MKKRTLFFCLFIYFNLFAQENKLKINDQAPNFIGFDQNHKKIELNKLLEKGDVVLFFYRGEWCPNCNKQMKNVQDSLPFLLNKGISVIAVTPESSESTTKAIAKTGATFSILNDKDYVIMKLYGVNYSVDTAMINKYKNHNIDLINANKNTHVELPVPATYIITKDRKIKFIDFDKNYKRRASIASLLQNL